MLQVTDLRDLHKAAKDDQRNDLAMTLTVVTTLGLPISSATGYFGMNFTDMQVRDVWFREIWKRCMCGECGVVGQKLMCADVDVDRQPSADSDCDNGYMSPVEQFTLSLSRIPRNVVVRLGPADCVVD